MADETTTDIDLAEIDGATLSGPSTGVADRIDALSTANGGAYSSYVGDDFDTRMNVADAMINAEKVSDHLGETIHIKNVLAQKVTLTNPETGEINEAPRVTLVAEDGTAYVATSVGVLTSVSNLIGVLGQPSTWPHPVPVKIKQQGQGTRKYFTFELDRAALAEYRKKAAK